MENKNYVILTGAPKAGTSSIAAAFAGTPDVAVARIKEPCFFTDFASRDWQGPKADGLRKQIVGDWDVYDSLFADAPWRMDLSTDYLSCPGTPERLAAFAERHPVKIVAILRDPVARIISEFQHTLRDGYQHGTLARSLTAEAARTADNWHPLFRHIARSRYGAPIQRYRALFGRDFKVLDFHGPDALGRNIAAIARFVGVPAPQIAEVPHENRSYAPRSRTLNTLMQAQGIVQIARRVMPAGLRGKVRGAAARINATTYIPTTAELAQMRDALAEDIAWCLADPDIPTDHWDLAIGGDAQARESQPRGFPKIMADLRP